MKLSIFVAFTLVACTSPSAKPTPLPVVAPVSSGIPGASSAAPAGHDAQLESALASVAASGDGTIAVTVVHLGDGRRASLHGDLRLPMMSVFKLPLAIVALSMVEEGKLKLDQDVPIAESELRYGGPIADAWKGGLHSLSLETLIVRALQDSDNTAGDKLVTLEGGGDAITTRLRKLGILGVDVAEQELEIFARTTCPGSPAPKGGWTFAAIDACPKASAAQKLAAAQSEIAHSPNASTTDSLVAMLAAIDGEMLPLHRAWLHDTLAAAKRGEKRLKALLPAGTRVEHKTGTGDDADGFNIATNDVGIITLPDGQRVAIAVLTAGSRRSASERDETIARLGKAAWDHFVR